MVEPLTQERLQVIADEVADGLNVKRRRVEIAESLPLGTHLFPQEDRIRVAKHWLARTDEGQFRFALASLWILQERNRSVDENLLVRGGMWVAAIALVGAFLGGPYLSPNARIAAWVLAILLSIAVIASSVRSKTKGSPVFAYEKALELTKDFDSAKRYLLDLTKHEKVLGRFQLTEAQAAKAVEKLELAARNVGLAF